MTLFSVLALFPAIFIGFNIVSLCWPEKMFHHVFLKLLLGTGAGIGITSSVYYFYRLLNPSENRGFLFIEIIILLASLFFLIRFKKEPAGILLSSCRQFFHLSKWAYLLTAVLIFIFVLSLHFFLTFSLSNPHGYYDAFSIWNLHARIIFRGAEFWTDSFSPDFYHADYPLLIPASIARVWSAAGRETIRTPMIIAAFFLYGTTALLSFSLSFYKKYLSAMLSAIVLLSTSNYLMTGASQYADIPLAFFFLATGFCLMQYVVRREAGILFLCSLFAAYAAWTKNEGLLFLVVISLVLLYILYRQRNDISLKKSIPVYLAGMLLPLASIVTFKIFLAPQNDLFIEQNLSIIIENISSHDRYGTIITKLLYWAGDTWQIPTLVGLGLVIAASGIARIDPVLKSAILYVTIALTLVIAGYCGIYMITPWDLEVHLRTSANRLLLHIYPLLLLIVFLLTNISDELLNRKNDINRL